MEKLGAGASGLLLYATQLEGILKHNEMIEANIKSKTQALKLKEKELETLRSDINKKVEAFEKEKSKAGNMKKLVEECTEELKLKRNELTANLDTSSRIQREIEVKKKEIEVKKSQWRQHADEIRRLCSETNKKKNELGLTLEKVKESEKQLEVKSLELGSKEKELGRVRESIEVYDSELELKKEMVESLDNEIDSKSKESGEIKKRIEELASELVVMQNEHDSIRNSSSEMEERAKETLKQVKESEKQFKMKSLELTSKEKDLGRVRESIEVFNSELEVKKKMVESLDNEIDSKSKESEEIKKLIEVLGSELVDMQNQHDSIRSSSSEMEERAKETLEQFKMKSLELGSKEKDLGLVRESIELSNSVLEVKRKMVQLLNNDIDSKSKELKEIKGLIEELTSELVVMQNQHDSIRSSSEIKDKEKELDLLKNQIDSEEKKLVELKREMEEVTDTKKKDLELTHSKIEESGKQLAAVNEQLEVKEKRFQALNDLVKISGEQLELKSKELEEIERELKLKKRLRQMSSVLIKREKQQPISDSSIPADTEQIDTFMLYEISASLTRHEISSFLRATPNRAEFVLELVQDEITRGSTFLDTFLENLVLLFEELAKIQEDLAETQGLDKSKLQLQATEVATPWKEKTPKSSLEALAFLLFIMAYGLKPLINEEETALLASFIAQYEQAPILFKYLSINQEFVEDLIKKSLYIPAVRLICLLKLDKEVSSFSPSELLKKEIISFRHSAMENSSTESSQAREKDAGRLRDILELVADYQLEIDLPGDLIAKVMVQGERSAPVAHWSVEHVTSSSNPLAGLKKKTVLVKHTGVNEENLGTTSPADVDPINETSDSERPPIIHTYQRKRY